MQGSWSTTSNSNHEENSVTENDSAEGRHNKVHKSLADRFSSVFNKKLRRAGHLTSKHSGESSSSSSTPKFSDRLVTAILDAGSYFAVNIKFSDA